MGGIFSKGPSSGDIHGALQTQFREARLASPSEIRTPAFRLRQVGKTTDSPRFLLSRRDQFAPRNELSLFDALSRRLPRTSAISRNIRRLSGALSSAGSIGQSFFKRSAEQQERLGELLGDIQPGFGRLTSSLVEGIRQNAAEATGNLRSSLNQRNLLGSSFASNQIAQVQRDFAQQEEQARAEAFLGEIEASRAVISDIGRFMQLDLAADDQVFQQKVQEAAFELGLNEAQAQTFALELQTIKQMSDIIQQRVGRELQELGLLTGTTVNIGNLVNQGASLMAQFTAAQTATRSSAEQQFMGNIFGAVGLAAGLGAFSGES